MQIRK